MSSGRVHYRVGMKVGVKTWPNDVKADGLINRVAGSSYNRIFTTKGTTRAKGKLTDVCHATLFPIFGLSSVIGKYAENGDKKYAL